MGLPVFREPVSASESKGKVDASVAARSAIRRSRAVRHPRARHHEPQSQRTPFAVGYLSAPLSPSYLERRNQDVVDRWRSPARAAAGGVSDGPMAEADQAHREASDRRRMENGRALLRDALSYERPGRLLRETVNRPGRALPLPPPPPPLLHRDAARLRSQLGTADAWERVGAGTGRVEAGLARFAPGRSGYGIDDRANPSDQAGRVAYAEYSPRFAPAHRFDEPMGEGSRAGAGAGADRQSRQAIDINELPPLRRMGRRSIPSTRPGLFSSGGAGSGAVDGVDGLGDRQRSQSMSPGDDTWDNLYGSIFPDTHLPSATSSFASAAASASATSLASTSMRHSNTNSNAASTSTSLTAPSDGEYPPVCDEPLRMETDSEEGSEFGDGYSFADDNESNRFAEYRLVELETNQLRQLRAATARGAADEAAQGREGARREGDEVGTIDPMFTFSSDEAFHDPDEDEDEDESALLEISAIQAEDHQQNLHNMQRILNRLARRQDIPDDWWAGAGLSRNLSARVDRVERERERL